MAKKTSLYELKALLNHLQWHPVKMAEIGRRNGIQLGSVPHCMEIDSFARASDNICLKINWKNGISDGIDVELVKYYDELNKMSDKNYESSYGEDFIGPSDEMVLKASEYDPDSDGDGEISTEELAQLDKKITSEMDSEESVENIEVPENSEETEEDKEKILAEAFSGPDEEDENTSNTSNNSMLGEGESSNEAILQHPFFYLIFSFNRGFKLNDDKNRVGPLEYTDNDIAIDAIKNSNETREIDGEKLKYEAEPLFSMFCKMINNNAFYLYKALAFPVD